jgi:outer membrane protein TolC
MIKNIFCTVFLVFLIFENSHAQSLDSFINSGLKNSPLLYDFNNQKLSAKLDSLLLLASFKPQVNQVTQMAHYPSGSGWGYDDAITNGGTYSAVVNVTQPMFYKKQVTGQLQSLELINQTLRNNETVTIIDLKKSITAQYLTVYNDFIQNQFNESVLTLLNNELSIIKAFVDKGVYQITDLMNLRVLITTQKISITQSSIQLSNDIAMLNFLCGITEPVEFKPIKPEITIQNNFNLESSPLFIQFRVDSLKNINSKQIIDLNYRPHVNIFADGGFNAVRPQNLSHNAGASFGLNLSIPIYDGKQRKLEYDKINLAENTRTFYKRYYSSQYKLQLDQLSNQLRLTDNLLKDIDNQLSEQERLLELFRVELEKGLVRFLDFTTILNNYKASKIAFLITGINRLQIINQLNYLK